jgi:hypothetical protein
VEPVTTQTVPEISTDAPPARAIVVRHVPEETKPYVAGIYLTRAHDFSPLLAFPTAAEAVVYAAAINRRTGRWTA